MTRDLEALITLMTIEEKASLTTGSTMWTTKSVENHNIPSVIVTDGPAGARGATIPGVGQQVATLCIPCGSALGATFDAPLVEELGIALGHQARSKGARVLLAPTVNLPRSPLFGRSFECYSEDPLLAGKLAASFIRGVQSQNVATTVKHLVGNEAEFERHTINSVIDQRTLRELYLLPFELAVREGGTLGIMTSYNRMNGTYCAENHELLQRILRDEWGFTGFVVTDWFAVTSTKGAARAGLDLEMPAPPRAYGKVLAEAVRAGQVDEEELNRAVRTLLTTFDRLGALDDAPMEAQAIDLPEHRALARRAAIGSMVLLRNEPVNGTKLLPLTASTIKSIAVIGPNAEQARIMGGGSAEVQPHHRTSIIEVLQKRLGDRVKIFHEAGGHIDKSTPIINARHVRTPSGEPGFDIAIRDGAGESGAILARIIRPDGRIILVPHNDPGVPSSGYHFTATGVITVESTGQYIVSLVEFSPCKLFVDGECAIDGATTTPKRGTAFMGNGSEELTAVINLVAGQSHDFVLECDATKKQWFQGAQIGMQYIDIEDPVERAASLAAECDVAVVVVGTTDDWESEGHDRATLDLPGRQVELIRAVAQANKKTVVLVNSGAPVDMSWVDEVPSVVQVWFGGQEMSDAVVDVLIGDADPGGRLPITIPECIEHTPAYGNFPGEHGQVRYGEGLFMGYRWYESRRLPVRFPFGYGLSYTTFQIGEPDCDTTEIQVGENVKIRVPVTNTGDRSGSHVIQFYVAPLKALVQRPKQELKAFVKVQLAARETKSVVIELSPRDFSYWDPSDYRDSSTDAQHIDSAKSLGHWQLDTGIYTVRIGSSSATIEHEINVSINDNLRD